MGHCTWTSEASKKPKVTSIVTPQTKNTTGAISGCRNNHQPCLHRMEIARAQPRAKLGRPPPSSAMASDDFHGGSNKKVKRKREGR